MADEQTEQLPVTDGRSPAAFQIGQFRAAFAALPEAPRRTKGIDPAEAIALFNEMARALDEWARKAKAEADGKGRLNTQLRALHERTADQPQQGPPTMAVEAVVGGQLWAEERADALLAEAKADADRILDDARLQAAAMVSTEEPKPTGHRPTDFANMWAYVNSQLPVVEKRAGGLRRLKADMVSEAKARKVDHDAWAEVLPLVSEDLAGDVVDVREAS